MNIEHMKQWLESLQELVPDPQCDFAPAYEGMKQRQKAAIASLRQAIEQAEKNEHPMRALLKQAFGQPSEIPKIGCVNHDCDKCQAIEQAEKQEPVAEFIGTLAVGSRSYHIVERKGPMTKGMKLYAREEKS